MPVASAGTGPQSPVDPQARRRRHRPLAAAAALLLLAAAVTAAFIGDGSSGGRATPTATPSGTPVHGELAAVTYNKVNGVGKVVMRLSGDTAQVHLTASGLLDGSPHLMHIHAGAKGECPHGDAASDHNGHSVITTQDGAPFYGPPVASLTIPPGKTGPGAYLDVDHFPSAVPINYSRSIHFGAVLAAQIRQNTGAVVVVHGIDYNHNGKYDHGLSLDTELRRLPIEETAPALCGALAAEQSNSSSPQTASAARVYMATLVPAPATHLRPALHCDLRSLGGKLL